ncbi:multidrug effflux MFS transporter [Pigmentibacter ruber]|uniref:multidrug effflux MFS transporter n=1 Tax=Pigmentibacter ruber TaxID=2683196 RepID=UPI00131DD4F0|nr:multidrug effflux MFS transporter [Pigmentibacter ruber]BFD33131.1 multidrug effflux MFS transporter [Pigmentibacter ruber]
MTKSMQNSHRLIFATVLFLVPISQAAIDIYSPSLPNIMKNLQTTESNVQLTISLFLVALGLGQYLYGAISDNLGRKKTLFIGMFIFTVASYFSYKADNIYVLIISRFFQGLGSASIAVLSKAISVDLYEGVSLMKASAWIGLIWGVAPIIAPVIGGYLDALGGWRLCFLFLTVYGFIGCIFILFFIKETLNKYEPFSINGILRNSIIILRNKDFLGSTLIVSATNLGLFVFTLMAPFFIQVIAKKSQIYFSYLALVVGVIYILGAYVSNFAVKYFEGDKVIKLVSKVLLFFGIFVLIFSVLYPFSIILLMLISSLFAFSSGFLYPFLVSRMFAPFENKAGIVSANYGIISYAFSGLVTILLSYIKVKSVLEISIAYFIVSLITFLSSVFMFKIKIK